MKTKIITNIFYTAAGVLLCVFGFVEIFQASFMIKPYIYEYGASGILFLILGAIYLLFRGGFFRYNIFATISAYVLVLTLLAGFLHVWGFGMFAGAIETLLLGSLFIITLIIGLIIAIIEKFKK